MTIRNHDVHPPGPFTLELSLEEQTALFLWPLYHWSSLLKQHTLANKVIKTYVHTNLYKPNPTYRSVSFGPDSVAYTLFSVFVCKLA